VAEEEQNNEETAEPSVRDSGPVEGAPGEPGGSPGESPTPADEAAAEQAAPEAQAVEEAPTDEAPAEEAPADDASAEEAPAEEAPAEEAPAEEAPAEEAAPPPAAEKKKRKRLPRSQRHKHSKPARERPAERKPITRTPKAVSERGRRQERRGVVVSSAMDKTIVVKVDTIKAHPRYKKVVRRSVKFHAHDEQNSANIGDIVRIVETRPLSKTKHWKLVQIVEAAK
jgi:small subunit ribosomal protein S17